MKTILCLAGAACCFYGLGAILAYWMPPSARTLAPIHLVGMALSTLLVFAPAIAAGAWTVFHILYDK
jgi:hypothetical protein